MKPLSQFVVLSMSMLMGAACGVGGPEAAESESDVSSRKDLVAVDAAKLRNARIERDGQQIAFDLEAHYYVEKAAEVVASTERQALASFVPKCAELENYDVDDSRPGRVCVRGVCYTVIIINYTTATCTQQCNSPTVYSCFVAGQFARFEPRTWVQAHQLAPPQVGSYPCNAVNTCP